jgi:hypothetical protein
MIAVQYLGVWNVVKTFEIKEILLDMLNRQIGERSFDSNETVDKVIGKLRDCTTEPAPAITGMTIGGINHPVMYTLLPVSI